MLAYLGTRCVKLTWFTPSEKSSCSGVSSGYRRSSPVIGWSGDDVTPAHGRFKFGKVRRLPIL